jgi:hypothetical protein
MEEPFIIHPGAISSILHLLTTISSNENEHVSHIFNLKARVVKNVEEYNYTLFNEEN